MPCDLSDKPARLCLRGLILPFAVSFFFIFSQKVLADSTRLPELDLAQAIRRMQEFHPALQQFALISRKLDGLRQNADQSPAYQVELMAEDFGGSNDYQEFHSAEFTLALSSVLELGGKRQARSAIFDAQQQRMSVEKEVRALALMSQLTQSFIAALAVQERIKVAQSRIELAETTLAAAQRRANLGASSEIEVVQSKANLSKARLEQKQLASQLKRHQSRLASLMGQETFLYGRLSGDLFRFSKAQPFDQLFEKASQNPNILLFAETERVRQAELQLAESQASASINWQVGVRRYEATNDGALIANVTVPLFSGQRSRGNIQAARASLEAINFDEQAALLELRAQLYQAYEIRQISLDTLHQLNSEIIPLQQRALTLTQDAYERGRYSYQALLMTQQELLNARNTSIDVAANALLNQTLIEQLTAAPLPATTPNK